MEELKDIMTDDLNIMVKIYGRALNNFSGWYGPRFYGVFMHADLVNGVFGK